MSKLLSMLLAATFAAVTVTPVAIAAEKKDEAKKTQKKAEGDAKKTEGKAKAETKKDDKATK